MSTAPLSDLTLRAYQAFLDALNPSINPFAPIDDERSLNILPPLSLSANDSQVTFDTPVACSKAAYNASIDVTASGGIYTGTATIYYNRVDLTNRTLSLNIAAIQSWSDLAIRLNTVYGTYFTENDFLPAFKPLEEGSISIPLSSYSIGYLGTLNLEGTFNDAAAEVVIKNTYLDGLGPIAFPSELAIANVNLDGLAGLK